VTGEGASDSSGLAASATVDRRLEPIKQLSSRKEAKKSMPGWKFKASKMST